MAKNTIIVIGGDSNFYDFLKDSLSSLLDTGADSVADIGILDMGLSQPQRDELSAKGYPLIQPVWTLDGVPDIRRKPHEISLIARTALRDYFPGYKTYLWFDSDAWAQTPEFLNELIGGATKNGASIIRENGPNYGRDFVYNKWLYGNMIHAYGLVDGVRVSYKPSINIGILCLSDTAPHWEKWIDYYKRAIFKTGKINMDQHAFNAAIELANLPHHLAPARCNWIPVLSKPVWNKDTKMLCEPDSGLRPLSIVHLAGPNKKNPYALKSTDNRDVSLSLDYKSIQKLKNNA